MFSFSSASSHHLNPRGLQNSVFAANLIRFLNLDELHHVSHLDKWHGDFFRKLNLSRQFKENSGVNELLLKAGANEALRILNSHRLADNKPYCEALQHVVAGKHTPKDLQLIQAAEVEFKSTAEEKCDEIIEGSFTAILDNQHSEFHKFIEPNPGKRLIGVLGVMFLMLIFSLLIKLGGAIYDGYENGKNKLSHSRLKIRAQFLLPAVEEKAESEPNEGASLNRARR